MSDITRAEYCAVASESMKQAAKRPRPPLPNPASGSCSKTCARSQPPFRSAPSMIGSADRLLMLFCSARPSRNSIDR